MLAIEIDGDSHEGKKKCDARRQKEIEEYDVIFFRFDDLDVKRDMGFVLQEILIKITELTSPLPPSKWE